MVNTRTRESEGEGGSWVRGSRDGPIVQPIDIRTSPIAHERSPQCWTLIIENLKTEMLSPDKWHL